jgi:hypothetical protein
MSVFNPKFNKVLGVLWELIGKNWPKPVLIALSVFPDRAAQYF